MDRLEDIDHAAPPQLSESDSNEKNEKNWTDIEVEPVDTEEFAEIPATKVLVPDDNDEFIDPRLKDYPIPLVA
jgi:hypothetical protein